MDKNSGNSKLNILKLIRNFLILAVIIFAMIIIIPFVALIGNMFYTMNTPPRDSVYIGYLEFYAGDSLPSCRVMNKKYDEGMYTTAIYRVNDSDFEKVLKGVQNNKYLNTIPPAEYNEVAIQLLRKETNYDISRLDYSYSLFGGDVQIGFKRPGIILYFERTYD